MITLTYEEIIVCYTLFGSLMGIVGILIEIFVHDKDFGKYALLIIICYFLVSVAFRPFLFLIALYHEGK